MIKCEIHNIARLRFIIFVSYFREIWENVNNRSKRLEYRNLQLNTLLFLFP